MDVLENWIDKGDGLVALLDAAGVYLMRKDGVLYANDAKLAHQIADPYVAVPDPLYVSAYDWVNRVTPQRLGEIRKALAKDGNETLAGLYDHVLALGKVNLTSPATQQAMAGLVAAGVITPDEQALLTAPP